MKKNTSIDTFENGHINIPYGLEFLKHYVTLSLPFLDPPYLPLMHLPQNIQPFRYCKVTIKSSSQTFFNIFPPYPFDGKRKR